MADVKISAGSNPTTLVATDKVPVARSASTTAYAATLTQVATYTNSTLPYSATTPVVDGTGTSGSAATVSRGDHVHPTDTSRYAATNPSGYQTAAQVTTTVSAYLPLGGGTISGSLTISAGLAVGTTLTVGSNLTALAHTTRAGTAGAAQPTGFNIDWTSPNAILWINNVNVGTLAFASDYRIKRDVAPLGSMWDAVKTLRPISYRLADYRPDGAAVSLFVADDVERWGFVAHELQETLIPNAASGVKDDAGLIQSPNPWTVLASLAKALQEAMARIEALEGAP